jgi:pyruvate, orthophosphate dikinase
MSEDAVAPHFIGGNASEILSEEIAGSKAAMLSRMAALGLNVPPAFVLPTELCAAVNRGDSEAIAALDRGLEKGVAQLELLSQRRFGDLQRPLLVSVRSGAARSMPGMLDTILNVGLDESRVHGLIRASGNPRFAWNCYCRFIENYAAVVGKTSTQPFECALSEMLKSEGAKAESELDSEALERLAHRFETIAQDLMGRPIPADPMAQLRAAARSVYASWESPRAREYRRLNKLEELNGTAVTVQMMVFGNSGTRSGAGVGFTRNPETGANEFYVDFLFDAQGEDVVSGRRMPGDAAILFARLPEVAGAFKSGARRLETEFHDVQDIEFTVEDGKLYFLQTRRAKRTPRAALRIAVDLVREGLIDAATARTRLEGVDLDLIADSHFAGVAAPIAAATGASPGVATGRIAFDTTSAKDFVKAGDPVILVRPDTSTEDVAGFAIAAGILTSIGGRTAHAAVVARQMGKVCLVACRALKIDKSEARIGDILLRSGDWLSLDGNTGEVFLGRRDILVEKPQAELAELAGWRALSETQGAAGKSVQKDLARVAP